MLCSLQDPPTSDHKEEHYIFQPSRPIVRSPLLRLEAVGMLIWILFQQSCATRCGTKSEKVLAIDKVQESTI